MIIYDFVYARPDSLQQVSELLLKHGENSRILAGGTDLVVKMHQGSETPSCVIDLKQLSNSLRYVTLDQGQLALRVGALTTFNDLQDSELIRAKVPVLAQAAGTIGSRQIRSRATLGGNICSALPSADSVPALLVLEARLVVSGMNGERIVKIEDFFVGPGVTKLAPGEILKEIVIPLPQGLTKMCYLKHMRRRAVDLAQVGVAVACEFSPEKISRCRIALATSAPTPIRAYLAEEFLSDKFLPLDEKTIMSAAQMVIECARPRTSRRASAEYRSEVINVLTQRAIHECICKI